MFLIVTRRPWMTGEHPDVINRDPKGECPDGIHEWVFTIPKRLCLYFRFDRSPLGKLCRVAYDTVRDVYALEIDGDLGIPATCGELVEP